MNQIIRLSLRIAVIIFRLKSLEALVRTDDFVVDTVVGTLSQIAESAEFKPAGDEFGRNSFYAEGGFKIFGFRYYGAGKMYNRPTG